MEQWNTKGSEILFQWELSLGPVDHEDAVSQFEKKNTEKEIALNQEHFGRRRREIEKREERRAWNKHKALQRKVEHGTGSMEKIS